jgi:7 transmembrane receptor (rhodopsin family)
MCVNVVDSYSTGATISIPADMNQCGEASFFTNPPYNYHRCFNVTRTVQDYNGSDENITASTWNNVSLGVMALHKIISYSPSFSVIQWISFSLGTFGNILVLFVLLWRRISTQLVTQLLIGSLAVANVCMMLGVAWIQAILHVDQNWKFGLSCCKMYYFILGITAGCSTWTLAVVAIDR